MDMISRFFNLILLAAVFVESRGPHHPRGEKIIKRHVHYTPTGSTNEKLTEDEQLLHDTQHIQEHLEEVIPAPDFSKMSDEEVEFYYFQVHDSDKNSMLDGLELLQAILHTEEHYEHPEDREENNALQEEAAFNYYVELVDQALDDDDTDNDGFLSYTEFAAKRRRIRNNAIKLYNR
ncbi:multiple coagulation factor deficiency protein 2 homolog [Diabrotica virgifera virgifera]|uniref:Multiple coagulation factor deficiency protein 2 homolog n=1 Tax=Diabrotica virgifera virgifera TaxID=50390 RepID=A0A6P7GTU5_DIAVI|nr:multiple coagulation factor deficiency protein 2 homolog [Diabrotica virgifera virgifera]